jgi:hypothetical protein
LAFCCFWLLFDITWCGAGLVQGRCRGDSEIPSSSDRGSVGGRIGREI